MASPYAHDAATSRHRRRGVALSCAECRRLKLKCSRVFPCSNCEKKGCSAICPEGSLTTGKGNRFVLANTEVLHEKINQLANRVRNLEDALAESHRLHSTFTHPLLTEELLQIKRPLERERPDPSQVKEEKPEPTDSIESMGSLSIAHDGRSSFFGQTANSWYLLQNEEGFQEGELKSPHNPTLPLEVHRLSASFPFSNSVGKTESEVRESIMRSLPAAPIARKICEVYFRHAAWMYTPIHEKDFYDTVFRPIYEENAAYQESTGSHILAILLMALAFGTLLDLHHPAKSPEAMQFYELSRAALCIDSVMEEQSIPGIQALLMMCHFMFLSDMAGARWVLMGVIVKLAQSLGLHRDSNRWRLDPEEAQKRRELFYELLTYDSWQSLTFGRPPSLSMFHVDAKFPHDTVTTASGEVEMSFAAWKHRFSSQCLNVVHDRAFGARPPNYKVIQDLDRQVRHFEIPTNLQVPGFGTAKTNSEPREASVELTLQRYCASAIKEMTLFYMHRGYFARAMEDNPGDPMGTKYAPSVLAAYTSACTFVGLIESLFKQHPMLTERMWFLFTHVFSCAIVLGAIAAKKQMQLAPSALSSLEAAYVLFSQVSDQSRTSKILPILEELKDKAHAALGNARLAQGPNGVHYFGLTIKSEPNDTVHALNGMTRLVSRRTPSSPSYSSSSPGSQPASPNPPGPEGARFAEPAPAPTNMGQWPYHNQIQSPIYPESSYRMQPSMDIAPLSASAYRGNQGPVETMPEPYYGYPVNGYNMQALPHVDDTPSPHQQQYLPSDSWQNFFAPYNSFK